MTPLEGYPEWVMLACIVGGVVAALAGWRVLFYYSLAGLLFADIPAYTYTRFETSGPYLNLFDVFTLGSLCAALAAKTRLKRSVVTILAAMMIALSIGYAMSVLELGWRYEGLRELRKAVAFPVLFWVGYRCCETRQDLRRVLALMIVACGIQSLRQWIYVWQLTDQAPNVWRTLRFMHSALAFPPLVLLVKPLWKGGWVKAVLLACTGLAFVALILTQTRSLWIPQAVIVVWILAAWGIGSGPRGWVVTGIGICGIVGAAYLFERTSADPVDLEEVFWEGHAADFASGTGREAAIREELTAWTDGGVIGILAGRGLGFYWSEALEGQLEEVAWGHNGYTAYLSNLGLVGFVVFAVWLPWEAYRKAKVVLHAREPEDRAFGAVYLTFLVFVVLQSALSSGLLSGWLFGLFGTLSGGIWRLTENDSLGRFTAPTGAKRRPVSAHPPEWSTVTTG